MMMSRKNFLKSHVLSWWWKKGVYASGTIKNDIVEPNANNLASINTGPHIWYIVYVKEKLPTLFFKSKKINK